MSDWKDGLTPLDDWRKDLAPQTSPEVATESKTTARDLVGTGTNMLQMGASGAQLGAMFGGVPGGIAGGLLGGATGLLLPPSETPLTDLGATAGDLLMSRFVPGGANTARRYLKTAGKELAGTGLGALFGGMGDKAVGFQKEIPFGTIALYSATTPISAIAANLRSEASPAMNAASKLKAATGVDYPLSLAESTGRFSGPERAFTLGGAKSRELGQVQDAAAQRAFEKILGAPLNEHLSVILDGTKVGGSVRSDVIDPWKALYEQMNAKTVQKKVGTGIFDASGNEVMKTTTTKVPGPKAGDMDFTKAFGLDAQESREFLAAINAMPAQIVSQLLPSGNNDVKGLLRLRSMMTVLEQSKHPVEAGKLGQAAVMQYLGTPTGAFESGVAASGQEIAKKVYAGLGTATEPGFLEVALGKERAQALKSLADVMASADPIEKVGAQSVPMAKRAATYAFNKIVYASASMGAVGFGGGSPSLGTFLFGTATGATIGIGASALIGGLMMEPKLGAMLIKASKGDTAAVGSILRTLTGAAKNAITPDEEPKSKLQGLFVK